jgi:hypothetical protein
MAVIENSSVKGAIVDYGSFNDKRAIFGYGGSHWSSMVIFGHAILALIPTASKVS